MPRFVRLLRNFGSDERGVFAVIFGLMAIVLVAMGGAVVDYVTLEQTRSRAQVALDAAALALQERIFETPVNASDIEAKSLALLRERIGDDSILSEMDIVRYDVAAGSLYLQGHFRMPTQFVSLVGVNTLGATVWSEATRRKTELEVVMVLDNSGSMDDYFEGKNQFRMTSLVNAAKNATEILFDNVGLAPNVKIGLVPFTQFVNVGTANAHASWLNRAGSNAIMRDNFDSDDNPATSFTAAFDRIDQFTKLKTGYTWGGCVEARQSPFDTNDTPPTSDATKFVPLFMPDEPDIGSFHNSYVSDTGGSCTAPPSCTWKRVLTNCNSSYGNCSDPKNYTYTYRAPNGTTTTSAVSCIGDGVQSGSTTSVQGGNSSNRTLTETRYYVFPRVMQERVCKYEGGTVTKASRSQATGPNGDCPVHAIVPLTTNEQTVLSAIERMRPAGAGKNQPEGGTNIAQGAVWGLHALSRAEPLTEGSVMDAFTEKVMILMTDGDNFHKPSSNMNGSLFFNPFGYPYNNTRANAGRLGQPGWTEAQLVAEMNRRTLATCSSAKNDLNVQIYTIGLYSTTPATIQMLKDCSSGEGYYYPATATNLNAVFEAIARKLQPLTIVR